MQPAGWIDEVEDAVGFTRTQQAGEVIAIAQVDIAQRESLAARFRA